jgi:ribonuclease HII
MSCEDLVGGVDEAGRGPLAGPVFAAAVILDPRHQIPGLADSKMLSAAKREQLGWQIREFALSWAVASASVEEIDQMNILRASLLAMRRAVEALSIRPTALLVDGIYCPEVTMPARAVVKGDRTVAAISAASILAKTSRDAEMLRLHAIFPGYGLDRHKGYPTAAHLAAITQLGICEIYRKSFAPVRRVIESRRAM